MKKPPVNKGEEQDKAESDPNPIGALFLILGGLLYLEDHGLTDHMMSISHYSLEMFKVLCQCCNILDIF